MRDLADLCDHTFLLTPECFRDKATDAKGAVQLRAEALEAFLKESLELKPYALCIRAEDCHFVRQWLAAHSDRDFVIAATVGFPDGSRCDTDYKCLQTCYALEAGAHEIDMVLNVAAAQAGDWGLVEEDLAAVIRAAHETGGLVKVILETSELSMDQIAEACVICERASADFVKTSTGFGRGGATVEAVKLMSETFSRGIKISGGVTAQNVESLLDAALANGKRARDPSQLRIGESSLLRVQGAST